MPSDGAIHVDGGTNDPVKVRVKHDVATEKMAVKPTAAWRSVSEMNLQRPLLSGAEETDRPVNRAQRQFRRLAHRAAANQDGNRHKAVAPRDRKPHALVMDMDEARQRLKRGSDRRLLANKKRERAKVGEIAILGKSQS